MNRQHGRSGLAATHGQQLMHSNDSKTLFSVPYLELCRLGKPLPGGGPLPELLQARAPRPLVLRFRNFFDYENRQLNFSTELPG